MGDLIKGEPRHDGKSSLKMARIIELCLELEATKQKLERTRAELRQAKRDAEPVRHGKWREIAWYDEDGYYGSEFKCSECGRIKPIKEPYCRCGAKMDLEG
jgi:hypothetical protein